MVVGIEAVPAAGVFGAHVRGVDLSCSLGEHEIDAIKDLIDEFAVLHFPEQELSEDAQVEFSSFFGPVQTSISVARPGESRRFKREDVSDISNVGEGGKPLEAGHMRRRLQLANQLWHTDNSFREPSGGYTFLFARAVPVSAGETEFADSRAAFDRLDADVQRRVEELRIFHSLSRSRAIVHGPPLSAEESRQFPGKVQPLVLTTSNGRKSLYAGSHADHVVGLDRDEGRDLLNDLNDTITDSRFTYSHSWAVGDLVMWDNRATLHRGRPFDESRNLRDLRRTTVAYIDKSDAKLPIEA